VDARTVVEVDLPAQTTLDQAIVALLKLRRGDVPGDATLDRSAVLRFAYTTSEEATPTVPRAPSGPHARGVDNGLALEADRQPNNTSINA
jgi:hypothetical protein